MTVVGVSGSAPLTRRPPTARQLRLRARRERRRHRTRSWGDLFTDLYMIAFLVAIYGWAAVDASRRFVRFGSSGPVVPGERYWIAAAAALALAGLAWQATRALGPLQISAATQSWLASAPVDRRGLLLPRFALVAGGAGVLLAVLAAAGMAVGGATAPVDYGIAAVAGAGWGIALVAAGVTVQARRGVGWRGGQRWAAPVLLGAGGLLAVGVVAAHYAHVGLATPVLPILPAFAVAGVPLAAVATVLAVRALGDIDRSTLSTGAQFASAAASAVVLLDPSGFSGLIENRRWRDVGRVRSRRLQSGPRWWVLLQSEARRLGRRPAALGWWGALVLVLYAIAVTLPQAAGPAQVVGAYLAGQRLAGGLRQVGRSPGLRRVLGGSDAGLRAVHLVVPAIGVVAWWAATATGVAGTGGAGPLWLVAVLVLGVVAAVYRSATRGPMVYGGTVAATPMGMIPVDLIRQVLRGPDLVAVLVALQVLLG